MNEVDFIADDKKVDYAKFTYASEEIIKKTFAPLFRKYKVLFLPNIVKSEMNDRNITTIDMRYSFYDAETGAVINGSFAGQGQDPADKGIWKALTGAIKYILTTTFFIPTGNDPENTPIDPVKNFVETKRTTVAPLKSNRPSFDGEPTVEDITNLFDGPPTPKVGTMSGPLELRKSGPNAANPNKLFWFNTEEGNFHSFYDKNPDGNL